jgi:hypothetical protein
MGEIGILIEHRTFVMMSDMLVATCVYQVTYDIWVVVVVQRE